MESKIKKLSEEHKRNISLSLKKHKQTEEHKRNVSLALKGRKLTKETREKLSKTRKRLFKEKKLIPSSPWLGKKQPLKMIEKRISKLRNRKRKPFTEKWRTNMSLSHIGKKLSKEQRDKIGRSNRKPSLKKKISQKEKWKNKEYREKQLNSIFHGLTLKPNKPERIMIKIIKENNLPFNYVGNGKIWFRGKNHSFNPDFLSKNPKHIIEVFGDYWHNLPKNKIRDKERLRTYFKYGYKTLVIWEYELKNQKEVLNKIREVFYVD
jgi:G:T-mismatch repair DNA endonuclease (very short patch repair protein)